MINSLQSLRGIFAIMIFLHHYMINGEIFFIAGGPCGVSFFLILSGFVMCAGYEKKTEKLNFNFSRYYLKRIIRIYPLHFLCLGIFLGINILKLSINYVLPLFSNLFLIQSWIPLQSFYFSGNAVSWCLSDLMFFYAVFPLIIRIIDKKRKLFWSVLTIILIAYISFVQFIPQRFQHALIYINPLFRLIDFCLGIALWQLWIVFKEKKIAAQSAVWRPFLKSIVEISSIIVVTITLLAYPYCQVWFNLCALWWIPCLYLILIFTLFNKSGGVLTKFMNWHPLVAFGDFSFSFYMIHKLFIDILSGVFNRCHIEIDQYLKMAIILVVVIGIAWTIYTYFEKPISKYLLNKF